jgi:3-oxoadipate enol-lactonase
VLRAPQMLETLLASGFAGPLSRPELSRRDRELATVAVLAAIGGADAQLAVHLRAALRQGIAASELLALAEHIALYAGFPRALNVVATIDETIAQAGLDRPPRLERIALPTHETQVAAIGDSGSPVVLLHALGLDWRMWEPGMPALAQRQSRSPTRLDGPRRGSRALGAMRCALP